MSYFELCQQRKAKEDQDLYCFSFHSCFICDEISVVKMRCYLRLNELDIVLHE